MNVNVLQLFHGSYIHERERVTIVSIISGIAIFKEIVANFVII